MKRVSLFVSNTGLSLLLDTHLKIYQAHFLNLIAAPEKLNKLFNEFTDISNNTYISYIVRIDEVDEDE